MNRTNSLQNATASTRKPRAGTCKPWPKAAAQERSKPSNVSLPTRKTPTGGRSATHCGREETARPQDWAGAGVSPAGKGRGRGARHARRPPRGLATASQARLRGPRADYEKRLALLIEAHERLAQEATLVDFLAAASSISTAAHPSRARGRRRGPRPRRAGHRRPGSAPRADARSRGGRAARSQSMRGGALDSVRQLSDRRGPRPFSE